MKNKICISHKEDVDGISSAALIKTAFDVNTVILVDYANMLKTLRSMVSSRYESNIKIDYLFICDLGLSKKNENEFVDILKELIETKCQVTYIDHHDLDKKILSDLKNIGVKLMHGTGECTSIHIYHKYKRKLSSHSAFIAAAAAMTDYLETRPIASNLVSRFDRQFLMLEATALSYMISSSQHDNDFLMTIVDDLSQGKYPHDIEGGFLKAEKHARKVLSVVTDIENSINLKKNLAYVQINSELPSSMVVNFVLGISGKPVALVYKIKKEIESCIISIRGSNECKVHLGRIVNSLSSDLSGSGGGHEKACGAVIPKQKFAEFIKQLDSKSK
ncbi:MAG TPA: DHHA1 domain-containing protein [Nitrososphaeraceae archaeon]|nr:DHHA1 domain-containing protein [Nitrososphaeraceae archaeon]